MLSITLQVYDYAVPSLTIKPFVSTMPPLTAAVRQSGRASKMARFEQLFVLLCLCAATGVLCINP